MLLNQLPHLGLHALLLPAKLPMGPRPLLGGIGWKPQTIQGKEGAPQKPHLLADQKNIPKQRHNLILHRGDKRRNRAMVRPLPTRQRHKGHILTAGPLDLARRVQPPGIAKQNHLQKNFWIIGQAASLIVLILLIKATYIHALFNKRVNGELQGAGHDLIFQRNRKHDHLLIAVWFVLCHG